MRLWSTPGIEAEHSELAPDVSVIRVAGELDLYSLDPFQAVVAEAEDSQNRVIILDMRDLGFIDSSGLGVVIGIQGRCQKADRSLVIIPSPVIAHTLKVTGLHQVLRVAPSPEDALALA